MIGKEDDPFLGGEPAYFQGGAKKNFRGESLAISRKLSLVKYDNLARLDVFV